jgi:hypothetical protein
VWWMRARGGWLMRPTDAWWPMSTSRLQMKAESHVGKFCCRRLSFLLANQQGAVPRSFFLCLLMAIISHTSMERQSVTVRGFHSYNFVTCYCDSVLFVQNLEEPPARVHHASQQGLRAHRTSSCALEVGTQCAAQALTRGFFRLYLASFVNEQPAIMQSQNGSIDAICAVCQNWLTGADNGHVAVVPIFLSEPVAACTACHGMFAALASTCDEIVCDLMQRDPEPIYVTALVPDVCRSMDAFAAAAQLQPAVDSRLYMRLVTMSMLKSKQPELQLQKNGCIGVEVIVNIRADAPERKLSRSDSMPMTLVKHFAHLEIGFNVVREPV